MVLITATACRLFKKVLKMFQIPTFEEIRDSILRDTQSLDPTADISSDSDHFVHASRLASVAVGQYAHQAWIMRQIFPDTADSEYLERHANLRGIRRRNPTGSAGYATGSGALSGAVIDVGLQIKQDERFFVTTEQTIVQPDGHYRVAVKAVDKGLNTNVSKGQAQFMAAPVGVPSDCVINAEGGTDAENDASLLKRLLARIRRPAAGGNRYDFQEWALDVDGVTSAYIYPLRRGLGTVDIVITSSNKLPTPETVQACQDYIDSMRPVTAKNVLVMAPEPVAVNVDVGVFMPGIDDIQTPIERAVTEYFDSLIPGEDLVKSQIEAIVSNVVGVQDRAVHNPLSNMIADKDAAADVGWFRLGVLTVSSMA